MKRHIAIKGNAERGNEIIELLEMMGGKNSEHFTGRDSSRYYFIDNNTKCICSENAYEMEMCYNGVYIFFSLNCFKDDYPWVVGDIVNVIGRENRTGLKIVKMQWGDAYNTMMYCLDCGKDGYGWWRAEDIEYTNSDFKVDLNDTVNNNIEFDLTKYSYEVKDGKLIIGEKKHEYPKTYKECCERVNACPTVSISYDNDEDMLYNNEVDLTLLTLRKLLICRNAYWKIVGEELGLDKPWEPDWNNIKNVKHGITSHNDVIKKVWVSIDNIILAFPTEEMRDTFYENFKDLIESCKELL